MKTLSGLPALVTGASSGIGRAIALALAEHGAPVALLARREDRLEEVAATIRENGGAAQPIPCDLGDFEAIPGAVTRAAETLGGLAILINAAGVGRQARLTDGKVADWKAMLDINVMALAIVTREALPHFPEQGGDVVNVSSMSGHRVPGKGGFYAATKFAVRAMTEGLRQELRAAGNPTRVGSISPGFVDTELLDDYFSGGSGGDKYDTIGYPLLQPAEIAELVLHQLSLPRTAEVTDILVRPSGQRV